tara:strand:+ start:2184 stop:3011 length:828 start_codon:yes stop_codon:yes gene_type:complete
MYQPIISKSPLLSTGIIERDYASGLPDQAPETIKPISAPSPSTVPSPKKTFKPNAKPEPITTKVDATSQENINAEQIPNSTADPVDEFSFESETNHLDDAVIDAENTVVEIPDDVARETAKQFTLFLDMGVAMLSQKHLMVDMNSVRTFVTNGEINPIFEEKFEEVNKANVEASHLSKENQKVVQQSLTAIIKDQKIEALNPTNTALANLAMVGVSHYASVRATIDSNERMIASALQQSQKFSDYTPSNPIKSNTEPSKPIIKEEKTNKTPPKKF